MKMDTPKEPKFRPQQQPERENHQLETTRHTVVASHIQKISEKFVESERILEYVKHSDHEQCQKIE
jgi:hypothetical protein